MSTELASLNLIEKILPTFYENKFCIAVFLDFSSCFDTISRFILLEKLEKYGVRNGELEFISSYFQDRKQKVLYGNEESSLLSQTMGVVQGSQNGPFFFDVYSNDLNKICIENENVLYADDAALVYTGKCRLNLEHHVNNKLKAALEWCNANKLSLNLK